MTNWNELVPDVRYQYICQPCRCGTDDCRNGITVKPPGEPFEGQSIREFTTCSISEMIFFSSLQWFTLMELLVLKSVTFTTHLSMTFEYEHDHQRKYQYNILSYICISRWYFAGVRVMFFTTRPIFIDYMAKRISFERERERWKPKQDHNLATQKAIWNTIKLANKMMSAWKD